MPSTYKALNICWWLCGLEKEAKDSYSMELSDAVEIVPVKTVDENIQLFIIVLNISKAFEIILCFLIIFIIWSLESIKDL